MGERIGYRIRDKDGVSDILRKQWMEDPRLVTQNTWDMLLNGDKVGSGMCALRDDLEIGRGFAALVASNYNAPFDSIEKDIHCDISDHGLIEIDVSQYDNWKIYHIPVNWDESGSSEEDRSLIAEMSDRGYMATVDFLRQEGF